MDNKQLSEDIIENMEAQLNAVNQEREHLSANLGTADAEEIVAMVHNMEEQLKEFYRMKERNAERVSSFRALANMLENYAT